MSFSSIKISFSSEMGFCGEFQLKKELSWWVLFQKRAFEVGFSSGNSFCGEFHFIKNYSGEFQFRKELL